MPPHDQPCLATVGPKERRIQGEHRDATEPSPDGKRTAVPCEQRDTFRPPPVSGRKGTADDQATGERIEWQGPQRANNTIRELLGHARRPGRVENGGRATSRRSDDASARPKRRGRRQNHRIRSSSDAGERHQLLMPVRARRLRPARVRQPPWRRARLRHLLRCGCMGDKLSVRRKRIQSNQGDEGAKQDIRATDRLNTVLASGPPAERRETERRRIVSSEVLDPLGRPLRDVRQLRVVARAPG